MLTYEQLDLNNKEHLKGIKEILLDPDTKKEWKHNFHYFNLSYKQYKKERFETTKEWMIKEQESLIGWLRKETVDTGSILVTDLDYVILPNQRKKGYGTKLLKEQEYILFHENNVGEINLVVGEKNLPNRNLLEKMGYSQYERSATQLCIRYFKKNPLLETKGKEK